MFITAEEAQRRLSSSKNLSNLLRPDVLNTVAKSLVAQGENEIIVKEELSVSRKDIAKGDDNKVSSSIERIRDLAINRMMIALGLMTQDKFESATLKDLSATTRDLSRVIENTSLKESFSANVQFIVHSPEQRKISDYKVVDV